MMIAIDAMVLGEAHMKMKTVEVKQVIYAANDTSAMTWGWRFKQENACNKEWHHNELLMHWERRRLCYWWESCYGAIILFARCLHSHERVLTSGLPFPIIVTKSSAADHGPKNLSGQARKKCKNLAKIFPESYFQTSEAFSWHVSSRFGCSLSTRLLEIFSTSHRCRFAYVKRKKAAW